MIRTAPITAHSNPEQTSQPTTMGKAIAFDQHTSFLDSFAPLCTGSHREVAAYGVYYQHLVAYLKDGTTTSLKRTADFLDAFGRMAEPEVIVLGRGSLTAEIELTQQGDPITICWATKPLTQSAA